VNERTFLDRFLAAIPPAVVGLALLSLFLWQAGARKTPTIFSDELEWTQISRAIAATGHAARRGEPVSFKSLYAFLIAPVWWIHSTHSAYTAAKYIGTIAMCLTAVPVYLTARLLVAPRAAMVAAFASICTSALFFAGYLLPETLAYPTFALCAYVSIRALAGGGRRWIATAIVLCLVATQVRSELMVALATLTVAAAILWVVGPTGRRLRAGWSRLDHAGAAVLLVGAIILANAALGPHSTQWSAVTSQWQDRMWSLGLNSTSALALGLGLVPMICGLASLWLPERHNDPAWRAFAAYVSTAIVFFWLYTGVKAAYLSITAFTRVEERNLIYLGPLLWVGTVVYFSARRPWLPATLGAAALTSWLVLHYGYQLDYPYYESPGYGVATFANRNLHWTQDDIRLALVFACTIATLAALVPFARGLPVVARRAALAVVVTAVVAWMLTGEITSSNGAAAGSRALMGNLPQPADWVDRAAKGGGVTFLGQDISTGDSLGVNLEEFWNRSLKHIWSLDGTAPPPGPRWTPDLLHPDGTLRLDPGLPYVLETSAVDMIGTRVAKNGGLTLVRVLHPWRLRQASYGVAYDGWVSGANGDATSADAAYAYFGPGAAPGTLKVSVDRAVFCHNSPGTNVVVRIGSVALSEQRAPIVKHPTLVERFHLADCSTHPIVVTARPPVAVTVHVSPLAPGTQYGLSDSRLFGARAGFTFVPAKS
jgi:hypothetical protein